MSVNQDGKLCLVTACTGIFLLVGSVRAVTVTWDGSESTNWVDDLNWDTGSAPGAGDDVVIDGVYTFAPTVDLTNGAITVASLSIGANNPSVLTVASGDPFTRKINVTGNCTIGANGTVTHPPNPDTELHRLFLDIGGDLQIVSGGAIDVTSKAYANNNGSPGGPGVVTSYGGQGYSSPKTYGSITNPISLGSSYVSYGGGGAIKLRVSGTLQNNGAIRSNGGWGTGGSILVRAGTLSGTTGLITANGNVGGGGRIALLYTARSYVGSVSAYGGGYGIGSAAGTIYERADGEAFGRLRIDNNNRDVSVCTYLYNGDNPADVLNFAEIAASNMAHVFVGANITADSDVTSNGGTISRWSDPDKLGIQPTVWWTGAVDTNWHEAGNWSTGAVPSITDTVILEGCIHDLGNLPCMGIGISNVIVGALGAGNGMVFTLDAPFDETNNWRLIVASNACMAAGGQITHSTNKAFETYRLNLEVGGDMIIDPYGAIDVSKRSYGGAGPGSGGGVGVSYGGQGMQNEKTYGSITHPVDAGSSYTVSGAGGALKLKVVGTLVNNGSIRSDGHWGTGGSVYIIVNTLSGTSGRITANAISGCGGGRIAVYYSTNDYTGSMTAYGNLRSGIWSGAGTIYEKAESQTYGSLTIKNDDAATPSVYTSLNDLTSVSYTFDCITLTNFGRLKVGTNDTLALAAGGLFMNEDDNSTLTIDTGGIFTNAGTFVMAGTGTALIVSGTFTNVAGSLFRYVGTAAGVDPVMVQHAFDYQSLDIAGPGQTFLWEAGENYNVHGTFTAFGESGSLVTLNSTSDGDYWYLNVLGSEMGHARYVRVKDSNAGGGMVIHVYPEDESIDDGHNVNWRFGPFAGTVISAW